MADASPADDNGALSRWGGALFQTVSTPANIWEYVLGVVILTSLVFVWVRILEKHVTE